MNPFDSDPICVCMHYRSEHHESTLSLVPECTLCECLHFDALEES